MEYLRRLVVMISLSSILFSAYEWKVNTLSFDKSISSFSSFKAFKILDSISLLAFSVNVRQRICSGRVPFLIKSIYLCARSKVLPVPGLAVTKTFPSCCTIFSFSVLRAIFPSASLQSHFDVPNWNFKFSDSSSVN